MLKICPSTVCAYGMRDNQHYQIWICFFYLLFLNIGNILLLYIQILGWAQLPNIGTGITGITNTAFSSEVPPMVAQNETI